MVVASKNAGKPKNNKACRRVTESVLHITKLPALTAKADLTVWGTTTDLNHFSTAKTERQKKSFHQEKIKAEGHTPICHDHSI